MLFLIQWQRQRHQLRRRHSGVPAGAGEGQGSGAGSPPGPRVSPEKLRSRRGGTETRRLGSPGSEGKVSL